VSESGGTPPSFLTSALHGGQCSALRPGRFISGQRVPCTSWIEGWLGPRVGLDAGKRKISCLCWESNPNRPVRSPSLYRLSYPGSCDWNYVYLKKPTEVTSNVFPEDGSRFSHRNIVLFWTRNSVMELGNPECDTTSLEAFLNWLLIGPVNKLII
jgi:hypothetical protein